MQLFLLHFAGGSVYSFNFLKKFCSSNLEFIPLELPGRGNRYKENLIKDKNLAIEDYYNQIKMLRNGKPYIVYGHSMGATLALSVVAKLEAIGDVPLQLIVSGNSGPGIPRKDNTKRYLLDDNKFKETLRELGGVPEEVLDDDDLFNFFSPIMRADFETIEKDNFSERGILLNTPLYAIMGDQEEESDEIGNWKNFTDKDFYFKIFKGNHFFIYDYPFELFEIITSNFKSLIYN